MRGMATAAGVLLAVCVAYPPVGAQGTTSVRGEVTATTPNSVTVKVGDRDMTFKVDSATTVTGRGAGTATREARAEGKPGALFTDIVKTGQGVEVAYHEKGMHAASIRVLPSIPPPAAASSRPATATGVVTAVTGTSLAVKGSAGEWTFTIDEKTKVVGAGAGTKTKAAEKAGQKTTILDFVGTGDTVQVRFTDADGTKKASEVRVTRKSS